jgi:hypothetical protein
MTLIKWMLNTVLIILIKKALKYWIKYYWNWCRNCCIIWLEFSCTLEWKLFRKYGVVKEPIDYTPTLQVDDFDKFGEYSCFDEERSFEIRKWLTLNRSYTLGCSWWYRYDWEIKDGEVITGLSNFVHTKKSEGIKESGIKDKLIKF